MVSTVMCLLPQAMPTTPLVIILTGMRECSISFAPGFIIPELWIQMVTRWIFSLSGGSNAIQHGMRAGNKSDWIGYAFSGRVKISLGLLTRLWSFAHAI